MGTSETAYQSLARVGEAISEIGEDVEKLHQNHVDRQHVVAELGRLVVEEGDAQHQEDAADHKVGVDLEEVGLSDRVISYFMELIAGEGAVRKTLQKYCA